MRSHFDIEPHSHEGTPKGADELLPLVYNELRNLAFRKMQNEKPQTIGATALVHEAYLRLAGSEKKGTSPFENRRHFFSAAAEAMRRILIERARAKARQKRGGALSREEITLSMIAAPTEDDELLAIGDALDRFSKVDPECAELVRLKFYVGLDWEEIAELTGVSSRTVRRRWKYAKIWLQDAVDTAKAE